MRINRGSPEPYAAVIRNSSKRCVTPIAMTSSNVCLPAFLYTLQGVLLRSASLGRPNTEAYWTFVKKSFQNCSTTSVVVSQPKPAKNRAYWTFVKKSFQNCSTTRDAFFDRQYSQMQRVLGYFRERYSSSLLCNGPSWINTTGFLDLMLHKGFVGFFM